MKTIKEFLKTMTETVSLELLFLILLVAFAVYRKKLASEQQSNLLEGGRK